MLDARRCAPGGARLRRLRPGRPDARPTTGPRCSRSNAIPGLTDTSLLPMAAEAAGISFERLCERLLELALERGADAEFAGGPA